VACSGARAIGPRRTWIEPKAPGIAARAREREAHRKRYKPGDGGMRLAKITVRWSNGEPFRGEVRLTKNTAGICQLSDMELQLSRDLTEAEEATTSVCTVTAIK